ncbi:MAG: HNH endonuclease, partial [Gordonia sp. (in: high G+C Gram-positive bacteria)]
LFPELDDIDCEHDSATDPKPPDIGEPPPTTYSPTHAKHARRRAERARNRARRRAEREQSERDLGPPPF